MNPPPPAFVIMIRLKEIVVDAEIPATLHPWFAVHVRANCEHAVKRSLEGRALNAFLPTYRIRRQWSDRKKEIQRPLFAGYVFCRFDFEKRLPILQTDGVIGIVTAGKNPLPVPDHEIEAIKLIVESQLQIQPWPFLHVGEKVRIQHASLKGLEGILLKIKDNLNVVVSVEMLQRSVAVEIEGDWVTPAGPLRLPEMGQR